MAVVTVDVMVAMAAIRNLLPLLFLFSGAHVWAGAFSYNPQTHKCQSVYGSKEEGYEKNILGPCAKSRGFRLVSFKIPKLDLSGSDYSLSRFFGVQIQSLIVQGSDFKQTIWEKAKINYSRWTDLDLRGVQFSNIQMKNFSFEHIRMAGAKISNSAFNGGNFKDVDFKDSYITDTVFKDTILPKSLKTDAILINVRFEGCTFI